MLPTAIIIATVFPARAGMSPSHRATNMGVAGVPRASGDEPTVPPPRSAACWCSPRERG